MFENILIALSLKMQENSYTWIKSFKLPVQIQRKSEHLLSQTIENIVKHNSLT